MSDLLHDAAQMQEQYQKLVDSGTLTKRKMCECCIPFRDKYKLTDLQTLKIARAEVSLSELAAMEADADA